MFEGDALLHNFPLGPSDHVVRHLTAKTKTGESRAMHVGQKTPMWNMLGYSEARIDALVKLGLPQPPATPLNRSRIVATVTQDGQPLSGVEVGLARSVSGAVADYKWVGVTGTDGRVEIEVTASAVQFRNGVSGYYLIRAVDPATDAVVASWGSVPINGGKQITMSLPVGGKVEVLSQSKLGAPKLPRLFGNFPNPFNPATEIRYDLYGPTDVTLAVYNELGQQVRMLVRDQQPVGNYWVEWDGRDDAGRAVSSGVYFYRLKAGNEVQTRRMMMLK